MSKSGWITETMEHWRSVYLDGRSWADIAFMPKARVITIIALKRNCIFGSICGEGRADREMPVGTIARTLKSHAQAWETGKEQG